MSFSTNTLWNSSKASIMALLVGVAVTATGLAQEAAPKKEMSDKVSEELGKIRALIDASKRDEALAKIDEVLKTTGPNSYDRALLSQVKVQQLVEKGDYVKIIEPLETALKLSDTYGFFDDSAEDEMAYSLAQVYYIQADSTQVADVKNIAKALGDTRRWLDHAKITDPKIEEAQLFAASIIYNQAQFNPNEIDTTLIKKAITEAEKGLLLRAKPKDQFYTIILAGLQQLGLYEESTKVLELLVQSQKQNLLAAAHRDLRTAGHGHESHHDHRARPETRSAQHPKGQFQPSWHLL
jgi:tetratricopeptide (TPR) repeat protein